MNSYGNLFYMIYNAFSLPIKNLITIGEKYDRIGSSA